MKATWLYLLVVMIVFARSEEASSDRASKTDSEADSSTLEEIDADSDKEELSMLPPIILLDFGDNDNSTSEEKSKRTIEGNLGYGYMKNNLFSGKYNYYFPSGQTGTTVSIEESITPFEPKTIIETRQPITENPENHQVYQSKHQIQVNQPVAQPWTATFPRNQPIFGQRTKLRKYTPSDYSKGHSTTVIPNIYTTVRPDFMNNNHQNDFTTVKSAFPNHYFDYSTTPSYSNHNTYVAGLNPPRSSFATFTTPSPLSDDPTLFNIPRYTVENGIRYENKIVWKYTDGRIANPTPTSYINTYSQYSGPQHTKINHQSTFQSSLKPPNTQNNLSNLHYPTENFRQNTGFKNPIYQDAQTGRYPLDQRQNIYSQKPAQFPTDQGSFSSRPGGNSQTSAFDLSYQTNYGFRQRDNIKGASQENRPYSKYAVNSANPEYTFSPNNNPVQTTPATNLFTQSGQLSPQVLSKFTPQAQKYLSKVFTNPETKEGSSGNAFIKNNYENLLNYNPSISHYIKDPSSILQATPTFIQAGESLVPVIILRIDGARPITPQATPNINLKALLQQYLTQYAGKAAGQTLNYNQEDLSKFSAVDDLTYLTQALKRFSPSKANDNHNINIQSIANLPLEYETTKYDSQETSYDTLKSIGNRFNLDNQRIKYSSLTKPKQKVKNIQIIEDPPNYTESSRN